MKKSRQDNLSRIFSPFYRTNMTPEELVGTILHDVSMTEKIETGQLVRVSSGQLSLPFVP